MIAARACDCCQAPLEAEVVRVERVAGSVVFLAHQQWSIVPRRGGMRMSTVCRDCGDYVARALEHLRAARSPGAAATPEADRRVS